MRAQNMIRSQHFSFFSPFSCFVFHLFHFPSSFFFFPPFPFSNTFFLCHFFPFSVFPFPFSFSVFPFVLCPFSFFARGNRSEAIAQQGKKVERGKEQDRSENGPVDTEGCPATGGRQWRCRDGHTEDTVPKPQDSGIRRVQARAFSTLKNV